MKNTHAVKALLLAGAALSLSSHTVARESAEGYLKDSWGNIVRSGSGECTHTGSWNAELANIVGCDGVKLDAKVQTVRGERSGILTEIVIPATAMFAFDSAELTDEGRKSIEDYRETLIPEMAQAYTALIIGHTDSQGDAEYNQKLSLRRAEAVRDYLVETGAKAEKLSVLGRGENDPIASNDTPEGQASNRRVEVIVIGEARALDAMRFPSVALFPRRSGELTNEGKQVIEKHRQTAREQLKRAAYIEIVGHTDDVGDDAYNQQLSEERAQSVFNYLASTGMDVSMAVVRGMGEKMPIASNNTDEGRAENRRVEILILGRDK